MYICIMYIHSNIDTSRAIELIQLYTVCTVHSINMLLYIYNITIQLLPSNETNRTLVLSDNVFSTITIVAKAIFTIFDSITIVHF